MTSRKKADREARKIFQLCLVGGSLDERRVRQVVSRIAAGNHPSVLPVLTRFHRLVRLECEKHAAEVESAAPLTAAARGGIEAELVKRFGRDIVTSFRQNPALIGGVRIKVGSRVFDDSIQARLAALEARL